LPSTTYRVLFAFRVDGRAHPLHTLPFYDIRALEDIHELIDVEPVSPRTR
jgi:hypothetical protein